MGRRCAEAGRSGNLLLLPLPRPSDALSRGRERPSGTYCCRLPAQVHLLCYQARHLRRHGCLARELGEAVSMHVLGRPSQLLSGLGQDVKLPRGKRGIGSEAWAWAKTSSSLGGGS